jgi:hypothetical protein
LWWVGSLRATVCAFHLVEKAIVGAKREGEELLLDRGIDASTRRPSCSVVSVMEATLSTHSRTRVSAAGPFEKQSKEIKLGAMVKSSKE